MAVLREPDHGGKHREEQEDGVSRSLARAARLVLSDKELRGTGDGHRADPPIASRKEEVDEELCRTHSQDAKRSSSLRLAPHAPAEAPLVDRKKGGDADAEHPRTVLRTDACRLKSGTPPGRRGRHPLGADEGLWSRSDAGAVLFIS